MGVLDAIREDVTTWRAVLVAAFAALLASSLAFTVVAYSVAFSSADSTCYTVPCTTRAGTEALYRVSAWSGLAAVCEGAYCAASPDHALTR